MNLSTGILITIIFVLLELGLLYAAIYFRKQKKNLLEAIMILTIAIIPGVYLFLIDSWRWDANYISHLGGNISNPSPTDILPFSWFHFLFVAVMIAIIAVILLIGNHREKDVMFILNRTRFDFIIFAYGVFLLSIEIYKQVRYLNLFTDYSWYGFPFQFCSVPLYVSLIFPWIKKAKIRQAGYDFLAFYPLIAGIAVMIIPTTVFVWSVAISIHTMIWHLSMVTISFFVIVYRYIGSSYKQVYRAFIVFLGLVGMALLMDSLALISKNARFADFNMFFIRPFDVVNIFVFSSINSALIPTIGERFAWLITVLLYIFAMGLGSIIVFRLSRWGLKQKYRHLDLATLDFEENKL
ncbi:MAG: YwaF family protein [Bacilli bacterium]|jgi:hypothetical protein|nr:YwaF family protein [Bacilli bacterium]